MDPFQSAADIARAVRTGEYSSVQATRHCLERIARLDERLHAFVSVDTEAALAQARAADELLRAGFPLGPLHGVPVAIKDLVDVQGQRAGAGSAAWRERVASETATVARRLRDAHMVVVGRTQMVEFAFGGWGTNPLMGTPRNPWGGAAHRVPGGSSSGSGVAVAAGLVPAALGSDTGGSVRLPAALNGITGLKTTYGAVPLRGVFPLSTTLDSVGPMARSARDCELMMQVMAGPDPDDPTTLNLPRFVADDGEHASVAGMRIGLMPPEDYPLPADPATQAALDDAVRVLRDAGATITPMRIGFDLDALMRRTGRIIAAEAFAIHRDYIDDETLAIGPHVRRRVQGGRDIGVPDYLALLAERTAERARFASRMRDVDALLLPTVPFPARTIDEVDEQATPYGAFTRWGNYLGACGLSVPTGFDADGLPLAMQILGKPFDDAVVLRIGKAFQRATDWHARTPALEAAKV
ncbi:MAG: amidase [Lautropia sp.]